ncbi:MAG: ABC transporter ATP-binding protein [Alphaproteobacteria bacterium]
MKPQPDPGPAAGPAERYTSPDWLPSERPGAAGSGFLDLVRAIGAMGRGRLALAVAVATAAALSQGAGLLLLVPLLDNIGVAGSAGATRWVAHLPTPLQGLAGTLILYVLLVAGAALANRARAIAVVRLRLDTVDDLRRRIHAAVMAMEWSAFQRLRRSDITQILTQELARIGVGVDFLLRLSVWAIEIMVLSAVILRLSPGVAVLLALPVAVAALLARPLNRRSATRGREIGTAARALQSDLHGDLSGMRLIKSLHVEPARLAAFDERVTTLRNGQVEHVRAVATATAAGQAIAAAVAAAGIAFAVRGMEMPVADAVVVAIAFARLMMILLGLQEAWRNVLHALPAFTAARALLRHCREQAEPEGETGSIRPLTQALQLDHVWFSHADTGEAALQDVSATLPARALTVIAGPSGAGKSTLADIVLGLLTPQKGRVLIDGVPLDRDRRRSWRARVGYVPQDSFLLHDTLRANLRMAAPNASEAALWQALRGAAAETFVRALPEGLDTVVGERGDRLSGGERQRIALARALLRRPDLLVLDEPTSALDPESERSVLQALDALRGSVTVVVVTHRPAVLYAADRVINLAGGRVVEATAIPDG